MVTKKKPATKRSVARKMKPVPHTHRHRPSIDLPHFYQNVTPQQYYGVVSNYGWEGPSIVDSPSVRPSQSVPARPVLRIRTARHRPAASRPHPRAAASMRDKGPSFYDGTQAGMNSADSEFETHPLYVGSDANSPSFWNFYGGGPNRPPAYGPQVAFMNPRTDGLQFASARAFRRFYENERAWERHGNGRSKPAFHADMNALRARLPKPKL